MPLPEFTWDRNALQYRGAGGRFVSRAEVRYALDYALRQEERYMVSLTMQLRDGTLTVGEWNVAMREELKAVHLMSGALAKGGFGQMTQADYGRIGQILRGQYAYLDHFAQQIAFENLAVDGRALNRVKMYFESGRRTYHLVQSSMMEANGFNQERSLLHVADHCDLCVAEAGKGWQPIGTLIPIGERTCLSRCKCSMEYRTSADGSEED